MLLISIRKLLGSNNYEQQGNQIFTGHDLEAVKPIEKITVLVGEIYGMDLMTNAEEFISYWREQGIKRGPEYHWRLAKGSDTVPEAAVLAEMSRLASSCAICEKKKGTGVLREAFWYYHNEDSRAAETAILFAGLGTSDVRAI